MAGPIFRLWCIDACFFLASRPQCPELRFILLLNLIVVFLWNIENRDILISHAAISLILWSLIQILQGICNQLRDDSINILDAEDFLRKVIVYQLDTLIN